MTPRESGDTRHFRQANKNGGTGGHYSQYKFDIDFGIVSYITLDFGVSIFPEGVIMWIESKHTQ